VEALVERRTAAMASDLRALVVARLREMRNDKVG
jgi:hypothetical protein